MKQKRAILHGISIIKIMVETETESIRTLAVAAVTNKYFEFHK